MDSSQDGHCRLRLLAAVEDEFFSLRRAAPDVASALYAAMVHAIGKDAVRQDERLLEAGARIVRAVELAARDRELAYHNRHHVAEVVLAMGWLCGVARRAGDISAADAGLGVVAMAGHDLLHDGSPPGGGVLEARAADAVERAIAGIDLDGRQRAVIRATIRGTNPELVASNAARAVGALPEGRLGRPVDLIIAMANEADVFASLLPNLGGHLTQLLALERRLAGFPAAAELAGPDKRLAFLGTYAQLTPAATLLGLAELRGRQMASAPNELIPAR